MEKIGNLKITPSHRALIAGKKNSFTADVVVSASTTIPKRIHSILVQDKSLSMVLDETLTIRDNIKDQTATEAAISIIRLARSCDYISYVYFSSEAHSVLNHCPAADKEKIENDIRNIPVSEYTNLYRGMEEAINIALGYPDDEKHIVLITDGEPTAGPLDDQTFINLARKAAAQDIKLTTLGFGTVYNASLLEKIASTGRGNHYHVKDPSELSAIFKGEYDQIVTLGAKEAKAIVRPLPGITITRIDGYPGNKISATDWEVEIGDLDSIPRSFSFACDVEAQPPGKKAVAAGTLHYLNPATGIYESKTQALNIEFTPNTATVKASVVPEVIKRSAERTLIEDTLKRRVTVPEIKRRVTEIETRYGTSAATKRIKTLVEGGDVAKKTEMELRNRSRRGTLLE